MPTTMTSGALPQQLKTSAGRPYPLGTTVSADGINFAVISQHSTAIHLALFAAADDPHPRHTLALDPQFNRTGDVWHIFVHGLCSGQLYGYRADGPYQPELGHRFNVNKLLEDPYAKAVVGGLQPYHASMYGYDRRSPLFDLSFNNEDSAPYAARSVALCDTPFDWENTRPPRIPIDDCVFYETHVRGFTQHKSSDVVHPGTFAGLTEKIPYLKRLGVTSIELLPVQRFNPHETQRTDPVTGASLNNYWGYATLSFFSLMPHYAQNSGSTLPPGQREIHEFKTLVKQLHLNGMELILDVVFNHTGEGNQHGPTISFRGLDNAIYYLLDDGGRAYKNYSGCGNTMHCNHPVVKQLIIDCLRYWVVEMQVDGFRFDLATILGRDRQGSWIGDYSLLYDISGDPILRGCKLIAEAWDAEGMYKLGGFPQGWAEWNGQFRDDVRRFIRGDEGLTASVAKRLGGSHELFGHKVSPGHSINFITAHDGMTLYDLVCYRQKQNTRNGENNNDGAPDDFSDDYGAVANPDEQLQTRLRQVKNMLTMLLTARGTPMLLAGDEILHTQQGNNNAYCQDNELSWINWRVDAHAAEIQRFVEKLLQLRRQHPALRRPCFVNPFDLSDIHWHGTQLGQPDWSYHSHSLALHIEGKAPTSAPNTDDVDFYLILNAWTEPLEFQLPALDPTQQWCQLVDTALPYPNDIVTTATVWIDQPTYQALGRSCVLLAAQLRR